MRNEVTTGYAYSCLAEVNKARGRMKGEQVGRKSNPLCLQMVFLLLQDPTDSPRKLTHSVNTSNKAEEQKKINRKNEYVLYRSK